MSRHCEHCGKEFEPRLYNQKFCSPECQYAKKIIKMKMRSKKILKAQLGISDEPDKIALRRLDGGESICMWCERPVTDPHQHFCSDDCIVQFYAQKFSSLEERGL